MSAARKDPQQSGRVLRVVAIGLAGFAILHLTTRVAIWILPYNLPGLASEAALLAIGAGVGLAFMWRRIRVGARLRSTWLIALPAAATTYLALSLSGAGWDSVDGAGFGRNRFYVFSTEGCELAARFPSPPNIGRLAAGEQALQASGAYAVLADLPSISSLRADCLRLASPVAPQDRDRAAETLLRRWAAEDRVHIERSVPIVHAGIGSFEIEGWIGGSVLPESSTDGPRRTFVAARAHVTEGSLLVLSAHQSLEMTSSDRTRRFLGSATRR